MATPATRGATIRCEPLGLTSTWGDKAPFGSPRAAVPVDAPLAAHLDSYRRWADELVAGGVLRKRGRRGVLATLNSWLQRHLEPAAAPGAR